MPTGLAATAFTTTSDTAEISKGAEHHLEVRVFAAPAGVRKDPVPQPQRRGPQWLIRTGAASIAYRAGQPLSGRRGVVHIEPDAEHVLVGGARVTCIRGHADL